MTNNQPVLTNGSAAAAGAALVPILIEVGVNADAAGRAGSFVGAGLALVLVVWHLFSARSKVTPVANPKGWDGIPLVSILDAALEHGNAEPLPAPAPVESAPAAELPVQPG